MLWWAGASVTGEKAYFENSQAKKQVAVVALSYGLSIFGLFYRSTTRGDLFVQNFMNPKGAAWISVVPLALIYWGQRKIKASRFALYEKSFGTLDDKELVDFYFWFRTQK